VTFRASGSTLRGEFPPDAMSPEER
jgi:hypothetical protein